MSDGEDRGAARHRGPDPASGRGGTGPEARMAAMRQDYLDFFEAEFHLVVRFVMRDGASLHDAQDCAQHAFVQAWRLVPDGRWDRVAQRRAWIRTVALRRHRSLNRVEVPVQRMPETPVPGPGHAELTGQARDLVAALRLLDADARAVLAYQLDDIPTGSIAAQLGIPEQRVRDLLKKARRGLKKHLAAPPERPPRRANGTEPAEHEGRHGQ